MKIYGKSNLLAISLFVLLLNIECQKKGEIAPFYDGLYFTYKDVVSIGVTNERIFRIKEINTEYEIIEEDLSPVLPETIKHTVDLCGFIKESIEIKKSTKKTKKLKKFRHRRIAIWIPPNELKVGNKFKTSFGDFQVKEKRIWEKWDVWVLKGDFDFETYYDIKTGFFVGSRVPPQPLVGSTKRILIETNADIAY